MALGVVTRTTLVTVRVKRNVPTAPLGSLVVPPNVYVPVCNVALVVATPLEDTLKLVEPEVRTYVVEPVPPVVTRFTV